MVVGVEATAQCGASVSRPDERLSPPHLSSALIDGDGSTRPTDFAAVYEAVWMVGAVVACGCGRLAGIPGRVKPLQLENDSDGPTILAGIIPADRHGRTKKEDVALEKGYEECQQGTA